MTWHEILAAGFVLKIFERQGYPGPDSSSEAAGQLSWSLKDENLLVMQDNEAGYSNCTTVMVA